MAKDTRDLPVIAFASQQAWNSWLASQPAHSKGVWLKLAKKSARIASVSNAEAVDVALCHGWIDGQLDSFDEKYWLVRFTPRQPNSKWSKKNRDRALQLVGLGRMRPAGAKEIARAQKDGRWALAYASQSAAEIPNDLLAAIAKNKKAARFVETLDRANRYAILYRVHNARKPETRLARIKAFVAMLAAGETIHPRKSKR